MFRAFCLKFNTVVLVQTYLTVLGIILVTGEEVLNLKFTSVSQGSLIFGIYTGIVCFPFLPSILKTLGF